MATIVGSQVAHTPRNSFLDSGGLQAFSDGAVAFDAGRIVACGDVSVARGACPDADEIAGRAV